MTNEIQWEEAQRICDLPSVDEMIRNLIADSTNDNAVCLVREIIKQGCTTSKEADGAVIDYGTMPKLAGYFVDVNSGNGKEPEWVQLDGKYHESPDAVALYRLEASAPARDMPEKIVVGVHALSKEYAEGWNDCIDEFNELQSHPAQVGKEASEEAHDIGTYPPAIWDEPKPESTNDKAINSLLWCYRRLKNDYGRLPFIEEAIAELRAAQAAQPCQQAEPVQAVTLTWDDEIVAKAAIAHLRGHGLNNAAELFARRLLAGSAKTATAEPKGGEQ